MRKVFSFFIESMYWLQIFFSPVLIGGVIALVIYIRNKNLLWLSVIIGLISVITGIVFAEKVRRKHGTSKYMSRIIGSDDVDNPSQQR